MIYILYLSLIFISISCNNYNQELYDSKIDLDNKRSRCIEGDLLFSLNSNCFLYDLKITDNYYIFLDLENDTVLRAYKKGKYNSPIHILKRTSGMETMNSFVFMKDVTNKPDSNVIHVIDKEIYEKRIQLLSDIFITKEIPLKKDFSCGVDYYRVGHELYSTPVQKETVSPYYFYQPDSGYYWVDPSPFTLYYLQQERRAYNSRLCVNENKNKVVVAYRFINAIDFYDLRGNIQKTIQIGDSVLLPIISKKIDVENSKKHFTYISGNTKYLYCLYDGTSNYTGNSIILVLDWNGKHIETLRLDRNLKVIVVDKSNDSLIGISSNIYGGEDIIEYKL